MFASATADRTAVVAPVRGASKMTLGTFGACKIVPATFSAAAVFPPAGTAFSNTPARAGMGV